MPFTNHQQLEVGAEGGADWDTLLNGNTQILERGFHIKGTAGSAIASGQICLINSAGYVVPMDARSLANRAAAISYRSVNSGVEAQFVTDGIVASMGVWSGSLKLGQPVFPSMSSSIGYVVASFAGHGNACGIAIAPDAIRFLPGFPNVLPELTSEVYSSGAVLVGSYVDFTMSLANRGIARTLKVSALSANLYKVQFWSGSSRVSSELLYETLTRSTSIGSGDVNSLFYWDQAPFPWFNTDIASPALVFGRITVQSGCQVNTGFFSATVQVERFR